MPHFYLNTVLTFENYLDFVFRMLLAMLCGGLVGLERERRLKNAGLRTHIIVALAASMMMIISKYGFMDIVGIEGLRLQADGSRIASSVVQAIGFIGAGVIYIRRENAVGLTTAAGLWATVGIGLSIGSGLYGIGIIATIFILLVQWILHSFHSRSHSLNVGTLKCNLTKHNMSLDEFTNYINQFDITLRDIAVTKDQNNNEIISVNVLFKTADTLTELMNKLRERDILDSAQIYPIFF